MVHRVCRTKKTNFWGWRPDIKGMEDSDPTDASSLESWLRCHGSTRNRAYVPCANGHTVHITQLVNEYFNGNVEHASTDRLRRMYKPPGSVKPPQL